MRVSDIVRSKILSTLIVGAEKCFTCVWMGWMGLVGRCHHSGDVKRRWKLEEIYSDSNERPVTCLHSVVHHVVGGAHGPPRQHLADFLRV